MNPQLHKRIKTVRRLSVRAILAMEQLLGSIPDDSPLHKEVVEALNSFQRAEALFEGIRWHLLPQGRE